VEFYIEGAKDSDVEAIAASDGVTVTKPFIHAISGALVIRAVVPKGEGCLSIQAKRGQKLGQVDAYFNGAKTIKDKGKCQEFAANEANSSRQICTPATALSVLSVASYDFNDVIDSKIGAQSLPGADGKKIKLGELSNDSNAGSLRASKFDPDKVRPDLAAP